MLFGDAVPVYTALNVMGTVWVDSVPRTGTCATGPYLKNVQVRNNKFENTYLAGVRAGNHSWYGLRFLKADHTAPELPGVDCSAHVEVVGNEFMNVGENGPFAEDSRGRVFRDSEGNRVAGHGNRAAAISLSGVGSSGTGATAAPSMITDNTIVGGTYDAIVLAGSAEDAKVMISYNRISGSLLNGIDIVASPRAPRRSAEITVEGNLIDGSNNNRFLTKAYGPIGGSGGVTVAQAAGSQALYVLPGFGGRTTYDWETSCKGFDSAARNASRLKLGTPEVWTSLLGEIDFPSGGAPVPWINSASGVRLHTESTTSIGRVTGDDLIRYEAERCYNVGRIRVSNQQGVSVTNNDLGYGENSPFAGAPANGVVVEGSGLTLKAFTGNNIQFHLTSSVLNAGASFSVAKNYLASGRLDVSGTVTGLNDLAATALPPSDERQIGPRSAMTMPDETPPALVETGDGAPMVDGTMLTLTFNDMLDAMSVPDTDAFTVMTDQADGRTIGVDEVGISGMTVTLTLESAVTEGETITVAYDKDDAGSNVIKDDAGLELPSFTAKAVTNNSEPAEPPPGPGDMPPPPPAAPATGDGGCALVSAGSGVDFGLLLLPLMAFAFAFGLERKRKGVE